MPWLKKISTQNHFLNLQNPVFRDKRQQQQQQQCTEHANEKAAGWGCYPLQLCSRSRIAVPTAMLYCKVDTAVQRENIEHVRVTEGIEYMHTLAWGWATFLSGRWPVVRDTREGVSYT